MKANELRIGNFVYPYNDINLIDDKIILRDYISVSVKDFEDTEHLHPIPLTEEWLLIFGFERTIQLLGGSWCYDKSFIDCNFNNGCIFLLVESIPFGIPIKHVHQLQNLYFALTNEELTIKP